MDLASTWRLTYKEKSSISRDLTSVRKGRPKNEFETFGVELPNITTWLFFLEEMRAPSKAYVQKGVDGGANKVIIFYFNGIT